MTEIITIRVRAYAVTPTGTKKEVLAVYSRERFTPKGALHQFGWIRKFVKNQTSDELEAVSRLQGKRTCHTLVCINAGNYVQEYRDSPYRAPAQLQNPHNNIRPRRWGRIMGIH